MKNKLIICLAGRNTKEKIIKIIKIIVYKYKGMVYNNTCKEK